jgi:hypothetical protein
MQRLSKLLIIVVAAVFAVSAVISIRILQPSSKRVVEVVQDGSVIYTFQLDDTENTTFVVPYGESSNTILIEDGEICVSSAECPDKTCVKMGKLRSESLPIVCLPNHLIIRFAE